MGYKLGVLVYPDVDGNFRYAQCGFMKEGKFSGLIIDDVGGGEFQDFNILNDNIIDSHPDGEPMDGDEIEEHIDKTYPGLISSCWKELRKYCILDDYPDYRYKDLVLKDHKKLVKKKGSNRSLTGVAYGVELEPMTVGNSSF